MKPLKNKETSTTNKSSKTFLNKTNQGGVFARQEKSSEPFVKPKTATRNNTKVISGVPSGEVEEQVVGGRTVGEFVGDVARPVGTVLGNAVGSIAGALTGINISAANNVAPSWKDNGQFEWVVGFSTTGRSGWIVQKVTNTMRAEDSSGNAITTGIPTPEYWEAWPVDASGNVTPVGPGRNDWWLRPSKGAGSTGHWSMKGQLYFTTTDPATKGLTPGGVPDAGILLSSTSSPGGLGIARLHRYAQGTWETVGTTPTHTGSAK